MILQSIVTINHKIEIKEIVSFELGKELKKDVFHLVTNVGQRIYKHYAIDIVDPSSMQDACHMNFVIDLAHHGVSVAQW